jgi:excisionase family DNA binding protein
MGKRESQQVAFAVVELQDARDELAASSQHDVSSTLKRIDDALARLDGVASVRPGLSVAEAAAYLEVSEPTVRDWLKRGVLHRVPDSKPILVERETLRRVHRLLDELRERGENRDWLHAFADCVHDRAELRRPAVVHGREQMERGEVGTA